MLSETPVDAAAARADEIRVAFSQLLPQVIPNEDGAEKVSLSAGVAACPLYVSDEDALIRLVDKALYAAKKAGRDRVRIADESRSGE